MLDRFFWDANLAKIAVTGAAGFLGSHVARHLMERGDELVLIDDLSAGFLDNLRGLGVEQKCLIGDLRDYKFARDSLKGVEKIFHFAAVVGSVAYLHGSNANEVDAMQSNLVIDSNVFRACTSHGIKKIIYPSSVSVYPIDEQFGSKVAFKEEDSLRKVNPEGGYGWAKYVAEKQLEMMPETICGVARIFHAYGENIYLPEDKSQVIGSLLRKAIHYPKEDFVVWGDGEQRRCFVFIDDVMDALIGLETRVDKGENLTVNLGSTDEITVGKLAQMIVELSKKEIKIKFDLSKPRGALSRKPDLAFIKRELNWEPRTSLKDGLERTYSWAEKRLKVS